MKKFLSGLIMSTVAAVVLSTAGTILYASASDSHNSPRLVRQELLAVRETLTQKDMPEQAFAKVASPIETTSEKTIVSTKCVNTDQKLASPSAKSLVEYLKNKGDDSSFHHRQELASQSGMLDYRGTQTQNDELMKLLISNEGCALNTADQL